MNKLADSRTALLRVAYLGIGTALTVALILILRIPMFLPFLEYDPGDIPIYFCTYLFGPIYGLIMTVTASIIQGVTVSASSGWIGILMHIFATGTFVCVSGAIYKRGQSDKRLAVSLIAAGAATVGSMVIWNLIFTPIFSGVEVSAVVGMLPLIIAFNVIKVLINCVVSVIILKAVGKHIQL